MEATSIPRCDGRRRATHPERAGFAEGGVSLRMAFGGRLFGPRPFLFARALDRGGRRRRFAVNDVTLSTMRLTPERQSDRDWIDFSLSPPCRLVATPMQFLMMEPADGNGELVADLASQSAGLGKAQMMGIGGKAATKEAGLAGDELAMLFVAQPNGPLGDPLAERANGDRVWRIALPDEILVWLAGWAVASGRPFEGALIHQARLKQAPFENRDPPGEPSLHLQRIGQNQRVLGRQAVHGPDRGFIGREQ